MAPVPEDDAHKKGDIKLTGPQFIVNVSSSDSDEEADAAGYQLLPQEPDNYQDTDEADYVEASNQLNDENSVHEDNTQTTIHQPPTVEPDANDIITLPNNEAHSSSRLMTSAMQLPKVTSADIKDRHELWNTPSSPSTDINIDKERATEIRSAMSSFQLPSSQIPPWATNISEDQWKSKLSHLVNQPPTSQMESTDSNSVGTPTDSSANVDWASF